MFFENSFKEKQKKMAGLNNEDNETLNHPFFSYKIKPRNKKAIVSFRQDNNNINLRSLSKTQWLNMFTKDKLHQQWQSKAQINFDYIHKKFLNEAIPSQALLAKKLAKQSIDPDILDLRPKNWNKSSNPLDKTRPELKTILFETNTGLRDFHVVPLKEKIIEEGCDSRDHRVLNDNKWDIASRSEEREVKANLSLSKEKARENTIKYWKKYENNRANEELIPLNGKRQHCELLRYYKKYCSPYQSSIDNSCIMNKVKDMTTFERSRIEKQVKYANPGSLNYKEKINALVLKEMYHTYKEKYNELTNRFTKEEIMKKQRKNNKYKWNDEVLIDRMLQIKKYNKTDWIDKSSIILKKSFSQPDFYREILKPLVVKGTDIMLEQEIIKDKINKKIEKNYKDFSCISRTIIQSPNCKINESKYPIHVEEYEKDAKTNRIIMQNMNNEDDKNEKSLEKDDSTHFIEAYNKIVKNELDKIEKYNKSIHDKLDFIYKHSGTYREFEYKEKIHDVERINKENDQEEDYSTNNEVIIDKIDKYNAWSCCMNTDPKSKGCCKIITKKFRWNNENI